MYLSFYGPGTDMYWDILAVLGKNWKKTLLVWQNLNSELAGQKLGYVFLKLSNGTIFFFSF